MHRRKPQARIAVVGDGITYTQDDHLCASDAQMMDAVELG
jgi:hypothetical protein